MLNPDDIAFIAQNPPDFRTGQSRGYILGRIVGRRPDGSAVRIIRETVTDAVGEPLAKVLAERARKEYGGQLVTPKGDPLTEVMKTATKVDLETGKILEHSVDDKILNPSNRDDQGFVHKKGRQGF